MNDKRYIFRLEITLLLAIMLLIIGGVFIVLGRAGDVDNSMIPIIGVIQVLYGVAAHIVIRGNR